MDYSSMKIVGVPMGTDTYFIEDLSDQSNFITQYTLEQMEKVFGMEGYMIGGEEIKEGEYKKGSSIYIYAKDGKALIIKGISYLDETFLIFLQEVEKGTSQSHEKLCIVAQKPFKDQSIKYEDGTELRNITLLDKEVGVEKKRETSKE